jgi:hypothetical protein
MSHVFLSILWLVFSAFKTQWQLYTLLFNIQYCILPTECLYGLLVILRINSDYFLNNIKQLIFVMEKRCVFFEARTELLNIICTSFGFRRLNSSVLFISGTVQRKRHCSFPFSLDFTF